MSVQICADCKRAERYGSELEFQARPVSGSLVQVCKGCFLVGELREYLSGLDSAETRLTLVSGLETLYVLAKTQAEAELQGHEARSSEEGGRKRKRQRSRRGGGSASAGRHSDGASSSR